MCPVPYYHEPVEYDAERNSVTIRGISFNLRPYAIEIRGEQAAVWVDILRAAKYFHRKSNGPQPPRKERTNDTSERVGTSILAFDPQVDQKTPLPSPIPED
jgi:hypothetical protein